ncbi:MAG: 3-deoxy-manno-octulosonate cytidylyltransferase [Candidatus Omnitrophica bacterium CG11_big_fil_rev_8_21_14_0_20_64_10]|nr:MAG: 3-deoxy-manno-octulosonate cytidylyltransferase [Candidatus Omnitrophica bacterium CG11_big_fil_rev_8_21_14_0_20_64_10]
MIPARFASSRFPGKPLALVGGQPMILRVVAQALKSRSLEEVVVVTDDDRIRETVEAAGFRAVMTSSDCFTGTDRVAEAVSRVAADWIVNIQGDEPFLEPQMIEQALGPLFEGPSVQVTTLMTGIREPGDRESRHTVKVVTDAQGDILCFSRNPVPFRRFPGGPLDIKQVGLYAFRRKALTSFASWKPGPLERNESVELYRFLENGWKVRGVLTSVRTVSVDTPEDLERVNRRFQTASPTRREAGRCRMP